MASIGITSEERAELERALADALNPLAAAIHSRGPGLPDARMREADPADATLSVLAAWKVVDTEVKRLTAIAVATAGSYGASYEQIGAAWGITRQGARKKWPDAVPRPAAAPARTNAALELFGGTATLMHDSQSGGWTWAGEGADETPGAAKNDTRYATKEEAAAHAGAFLREHATDLP